MNLTRTTYPFYSYNPSVFGAIIFGIIVYVSLNIWFLQSLYSKCRPFLLFIFVFISHLIVFIELIIRGSLHISILRTQTLFRINSPLCSIPARLLLFSNYYCLVELRGKKSYRTIDHLIVIVVLIVAVTADLLLALADQFSFHLHRYSWSFYLRQISAGLILCLTMFFYVVWYLTVSHVRHFYVFPLLSISSVCILIEAIYIQIMSIPPLFIVLTQNELWFYVGHVIPLVLTLCTWSIYHPGRLLPPAERDVPHDAMGQELLPTPPLI